MLYILSLVVGIFFAGATYLLLQRSMLKLVPGLVLLGQATTLLIFAMGVPVTPPAAPPIAPLVEQPEGAPDFPTAAAEAETVPADPIAQAMAITALLIEFGLTTLALTIAYRIHQAARSDDLEQLTTTDGAP